MRGWKIHDAGDRGGILVLGGGIGEGTGLEAAAAGNTRKARPAGYRTLAPRFLKGKRKELGCSVGGSPYSYVHTVQLQVFNRPPGPPTTSHQVLRI
jgi:hypothetical protein